MFDIGQQALPQIPELTRKGRKRRIGEMRWRTVADLIRKRQRRF